MVCNMYVRCFDSVYMRWYACAHALCLVSIRVAAWQVICTRHHFMERTIHDKESVSVADTINRLAPFGHADTDMHTCKTRYLPLFTVGAWHYFTLVFLSQLMQTSNNLVSIPSTCIKADQRWREGGMLQPSVAAITVDQRRYHFVNTDRTWVTAA